MNNQQEINQSFRQFLLIVREGLLVVVGGIEVYLGVNVKKRRVILLNMEENQETVDKL